MLVLSRKKDQSVVLKIDGEIVRVSVLAVDGGKVRLGIDAPESVTIHRDEVWRRLQEFRPDSSPVADPT